MSKKSKAKAQLKRLNQKRARKAARQAQYEAYAKTGQNKKSKRSRKGSRRKTVRNVRHLIAYCGNLGCKICHEKINNPWKVSAASCIYSKRFTSHKYAA